jgi:hypothetical protein
MVVAVWSQHEAADPNVSRGLPFAHRSCGSKGACFVGVASNPEYTDEDLQRSLMEHIQIMREMRQQIATQNKRQKEWSYLGMEDFLLHHGRFYNPQPLPPDVPKMTPKMCFENAFLLAFLRPQFRYVEGLAMGIIPVHHAWLIDDNDNVIDPTWSATEYGMGGAYFGMTFPVQFVKKNRHRHCLSVLDNWKTGYRLYKQPYKP